MRVVPSVSRSSPSVQSSETGRAGWENAPEILIEAPHDFLITYSSGRVGSEEDVPESSKLE